MTSPKDGVRARRHRDAFDAFVVEPGALVETLAVPADARATLYDKDRDPRRKLRELVEQKRQHFRQGPPLVQFRQRSPNVFEGVTATASTAHQTHGLVGESKNAVLIDVLFVLRHALLQGVEFLQELVLQPCDFSSEVVGPIRDERVEQSKRLGAQLVLIHLGARPPKSNSRRQLHLSWSSDTLIPQLVGHYVVCLHISQHKQRRCPLSTVLANLLSRDLAPFCQEGVQCM